MTCNDCCRSIESCVCSLWGGKRTESKLRALAEQRKREFWTGKKQDERCPQGKPESEITK